MWYDGLVDSVAKALRKVSGKTSGSVEELLKAAFATDVRPVIEAWRRSHRLPENPIRGYRESGYQQRIDKERAEANAGTVSSYA